MGIGNYSHRAEFLSYTSQPDGAGGQIDTEYTVSTTWAEIVPLRSSRNLAEAQINLKNTSIFRVRWRKGFAPDVKMKIVVKGRKYIINSIVDMEEDHRFWEITGIVQTVVDEI